MSSKLESWKTYLKKLREDVEKKESQTLSKKEKTQNECPKLIDYVSDYASIQPHEYVYDNLIEKLEDFQSINKDELSVYMFNRMHFNFVEKDIKHLLLYFKSHKYDKEEIKKVDKLIKDILKQSRDFLKANNADMYIQRRIENYFQNVGGINLRDLFSDPQFLINFGIKILTILCCILSAYLANILFLKQYERNFPSNVPNLYYYWLYFTGILLGINVVLITIYYVVTHFFNRNHIWTIEMMMIIIKDITTCFTLHSLIMLVVTYFFQTKKYFRYKVSGHNTINALSRTTYLTSIVTYLIPFFFVHW